MLSLRDDFLQATADYQKRKKIQSDFYVCFLSLSSPIYVIFRLQFPLSYVGSSFVQTNSQPCDFFIVLYSVWDMLSGFQFARICGVSGLGVFDRAFVHVACRFPLTSQKFIVSFAKLGNSETIYPRVH